MKKILITYFSASGVTKCAAEKIAKAINSDIYEIKPKEKYTDADLNWHNKQSRSSVEMNDLSFRPPVADTNANIEDYKTIFIGFPIWWYIAPTIINTFLESYDFDGKKIVLFATSGGSGFGKTIENLEQSYSENAMFIDQRLISYRDNEKSISQWIKQLDL